MDLAPRSQRVKRSNHGTGLRWALFTASEPPFDGAASVLLEDPSAWFGAGHMAYTRRLALQVKLCYWARPTLPCFEMEM